MKTIWHLILGLLLTSSVLVAQSGELAYQVDETDLIPEGISYSSSTRAFYLGSLFKNKIVSIDAQSGRTTDFFPQGKTDMKILGLIVDDRKGLLWACADYNEGTDHRSAVLKFDLRQGRLIKQYPYSSSRNTMFNDMALDHDGGLYITNSREQTIYRIAPETDTLKVFLDSPLIQHPNGIAISDDQLRLYVAATEQGLKIVDIASRQVLEGPDRVLDSTGLDGIKFYRNSIVAIQNEVEKISDCKIVRYHLREDGKGFTHRTIIDQDNPRFDIPTTLVIVGNELFCLANSQMGKIDRKAGRIRSDTLLNKTMILKYRLE